MAYPGQPPEIPTRERIQVASAQTLARRKWPDTDLIIVDEAHTVMQTVKDRIEARRDTVCIGPTATPFTRGLGKLYDALVNVTTTNALIAEGSCRRSESGAVRAGHDGRQGRAGEWEEAETSKRVPWPSWATAEAHQSGRGAEVSCVLRRCGARRGACAAIHDAGIRSRSTAKTSDSDRARMVEEFRRPDSRIRGLISPVALTKGFDVPDVSCLIMARPLRSSPPSSSSSGVAASRRTNATASCWTTAGTRSDSPPSGPEFFETGALELDDGKPKPKKTKDEAEEPCAWCAARPAPPFIDRRRAADLRARASAGKVRVAHKPGELRELIANGDSRRMAAEIWPQVCTYAPAQGRTERREDGAWRSTAR